MKKFEKPEMIIAKFDSESVVTGPSAMDAALKSVGGATYTLGGSDKD